jgi:hypothetical protein
MIIVGQHPSCHLVNFHVKISVFGDGKAETARREGCLTSGRTELEGQHSAHESSPVISPYYIDDFLARTL